MNQQYRPKGCSLKTSVTRNGLVRRSCVNNPYSTKIDQECLLSHTGKCVLNKPQARRKPIKHIPKMIYQQQPQQPIYHQGIHPLHQYPAPMMARIIPQTMCNLKTTVTRRGDIRTACVADKTAKKMHPNCMKSPTGHCVKINSGKRRVSHAKKYNPPVRVRQQYLY
jgi:hypothetical protein